MPAVFFTNLALLGGLAALAIPILIHLLLKRKKQRVRFSTNRFFAENDPQASRRRALRHWLLLALRLLLVALLVLAFTRPFTRKAPAIAGEAKRVGIFVVDRSLSMLAVHQGETAWNRALKLVRTALREFKPDDSAAIITCAQRSEVLSGPIPAVAIGRMLDGLSPEFAAGDLADGLRAALKLAASREPNTSATIYLVSDLQKNSTPDLETVPVPADIDVKLLNAGDLYAANVAVTDLRLEGHVKPQAQVTVQSFSDDDRPNLKLSLNVDGREVLSSAVQLKAGSATNLVVPLPALKPGWHRAEARLAANDSLPVDDVRYHAFFVAEPLKVLCVETKPAARIHEQDTFHVASALQPESEPGTAVPALFTVELADVAALATKLGGAQEKSRYAAVLLPALRQIPPNLANVLLNYAQKGGGILMFLGEGMSANRYNAEFRDLLPWKLDSVEARANAGWHMETFDKSSPIFAAFRGAAAANLQLPEFNRRFRVVATGPGLSNSTLAAFDDGLPLQGARTIGAGRVVLVNSSADASWSDWPQRKSFVPWLHGTVHYLAGRSSADTMQPSRLFTAGEDAEINLGPAWQGRSLLIERDGAKAEPIKADEEGHLVTVPTALPGAYAVRDAKGVEVQRWAVNVPVRESDLAGHLPRELEKQLARSKATEPVTLQAGLFGPAQGEREWWRVLLLAALCLLFVEVFLANRTRA